MTDNPYSAPDDRQSGHRPDNRRPVLPLVFRFLFGFFALACIALYVTGTDAIKGIAFYAFPIHLIGMVLTWIWEELIRTKKP